MKGQDTLGIGHRDAHVRSTVPLVGHLLKLLEILQTRLKKSQALLQDRLSFLWFEILEERDARKKLRFISGLLRRKTTQRGAQQLDAALGEVRDIGIRLGLLLRRL